jgi:HD-like signal output (HDOD) protein
VRYSPQTTSRMRPGYGHGVVDMADDAPPPDLLALIRRGLSRVFADPTYRPPLLPQVAMEVLELSRAAKPSSETMVRTIESSPMLASRVLQVARSPRYASSRPPAGLRQALVRMGREGLTNLVLEVALSSTVFKSRRYGRAMNAVRQQSLAIAQAARPIARAARVPTGTAFLAGLLQDVGSAGCLLVLAERGRDAAPLDVDVAMEAVETVAPAATHAMLKIWTMPRPVIEACGRNPTSPKIEDIRRVLLLSRAAVDGLVDSGSDRWTPGGPPPNRLDVRRALGHFKLDTSTWAPLRERARDAAAAVVGAEG